MPKTATINSSIEPELKTEADSIFSALGLTTSEALTLFYKQVTLHKGLPFDIRIPNKKTIKTMKEVANGDTIKYKNLDDLKTEWDKL